MYFNLKVLLQMLLTSLKKLVIISLSDISLDDISTYDIVVNERGWADE